MPTIARSSKRTNSARLKNSNFSTGKVGGLELRLKKRSRLYFVTPEPPTLEEYKIAKRFISRLNDQHKGGKIYSMDLRPPFWKRRALDCFLRTA